MEYKLTKKLEEIEKELKTLKTLILTGYGYKIKKPVSFRGIATTKLSEEELDMAIEEAQKSLSKGM